MVSGAHPDRRLTYDDLLLFPEGDGLRHEIIDGVHYVTPSPSLRHQDLVGRLHLAIGNFLATRPGIGRIFLSPLDVVFTIHDVVEPDLVFVAGDQTDILTEANIQGLRRSSLSPDRRAPEPGRTDQEGTLRSRGSTRILDGRS